MKVIMNPIGGTAEANLERAKDELSRVLGFRGDIVSAKVEGSEIILEIVINPKWDVPSLDKVSYLMDWIPAKVKRVFKVVSISTRAANY